MHLSKNIPTNNACNENAMFALTWSWKRSSRKNKHRRSLQSIHLTRSWSTACKGKKIKVKVWTLAIAPLTWVRLVTSSVLQSRKWQLIGISQWCRSALCGHPLPALTDNWTHGAASRHTIAPISHTRPSPRSCSYYSFPVPLRVGGWVGLSTQ